MERWVRLPRNKKSPCHNRTIHGILKDGAKRIRTADPLHAMQVLGFLVLPAVQWF